MKAIKSLAIALVSTAFLTACNNTGRDDHQDQDTMETVPPVDTMGTDTLTNDTL
ncbi:hypothetical protein [Parapedobacter sp. DT-150]|uniref:hypothetical protein n=1 Tax=Parapedobacter sp. DT-150 TaxID=3396162 RepID=UPI003F1CBE39